jgi:hypothetical protein
MDILNAASVLLMVYKLAFQFLNQGNGKPSISVGFWSAALSIWLQLVAMIFGGQPEYLLQRLVVGLTGNLTCTARGANVEQADAPRS